MHKMRWEVVCYKTLYYESKFLQIKLALFHTSHGFHEFRFLEIYIYVNKVTLLTFGTNIPQIVFDFII